MVVYSLLLCLSAITGNTDRGLDYEGRLIGSIGYYYRDLSECDFLKIFFSIALRLAIC